MERRCVLSLLLVAWSMSPSTARADDTDEVEVSVLGGMHVRHEVVSPDSAWPSTINAGALGAVEIAYRHDFARWSMAGGLRMHYETYVLDGWLGPDGPTHTFMPLPAGATETTITSFDEWAVSIGVPLRFQTAHADTFVGYALVEPMVVAHARQLVVDSTHFAAGARPTIVERGVTTRDEFPSFAVYGALGVGARVGPGRVVLEVGGRGDTEPKFSAMGHSSAFGWSVVAGYRLGLR